MLAKGIRGAPRDALVADITPPALRGAAFGLRQSLDTVGAFLGPLLAVVFMLLWNDDFRAVFWLASVPAFACVAMLLASRLAGWLWQLWGARFTFSAGIVFCLLAPGLLALRPRT